MATNEFVAKKCPFCLQQGGVYFHPGLREYICVVCLATYNAVYNNYSRHLANHLLEEKSRAAKFKKETK